MVAQGLLLLSIAACCVLPVACCLLLLTLSPLQLQALPCVSPLRCPGRSLFRSPPDLLPRPRPWAHRGPVAGINNCHPPDSEAVCDVEAQCADAAAEPGVWSERVQHPSTPFIPGMAVRAVDDQLQWRHAVIFPHAARKCSAPLCQPFPTSCLACVFHTDTYGDVPPPQPCVRPRCRWMWVGDGAVTLVCDGSQLALLLWSVSTFNEAVMQLGVSAAIQGAPCLCSAHTACLPPSCCEKSLLSCAVPPPLRSRRLCVLLVQCVAV